MFIGHARYNFNPHTHKIYYVTTHVLTISEMSLSRFPLSLKMSLLSTIRSSSSLTRSRVAGIGDVKPLGTWIGKLINRNNTNNSKEEKAQEKVNNQKIYDKMYHF